MNAIELCDEFVSTLALLLGELLVVSILSSR